jgi:hypothetical protein
MKPGLNRGCFDIPSSWILLSVLWGTTPDMHVIACVNVMAKIVIAISGAAYGKAIFRIAFFKCEGRTVAVVCLVNPPLTRQIRIPDNGSVRIKNKHSALFLSPGIQSFLESSL